MQISTKLKYSHILKFSQSGNIMMNKSILALVLGLSISLCLVPGSVADDEPEVETRDVEDIRYNEATLIGGTNTEDMDVSFSYRKKGEDGWNEKNVDKEGRGEFNKTLYDLENNTEYEFRAKGSIEDDGTTTYEGEIIKFSTVSYPDVKAINSTEITHESTILYGNLTEIGIEEEVEVYFNYTKEDENWRKTDEKILDEERTFNKEVEGLSHETVYDFKAVVQWTKDNKTSSENKTFETKPEIYVETLEPEKITTDSAIIRGELLGNESKIEELETNVSFWLRDEFEEIKKGNMDETGIFKEELDDLEPETEYEFRAEVHIGEEENIGEELIFMTSPEFNLTDMEVDPEEVYVDEEFEVSATVENDGETDYEYEARLYVDGSYETSEYVEVSGGSSEEVILNDSIGSSGDYELEVKVAGQTVEDDIEVYNKPSVGTSSPSEVGSDSAVLEGEVLEIGLEDEVTVFFRYGEKDDDEALWGETSKEEMEEEDSFEREVSLDEDKEYGYKAVLEWNDQEETGNVVSLMPDSCEYGNWENQTCGGWECDEEEIHQTKEVTDDSPTFCKEVKERCIEAEDYCGVPEAELNLEKEIVNVTADETETNNVTVANTGTKDLEDVGLSLELEGPEEWYDLVPSGRTIDQKEEKRFEVSFSPGGGAPIGKYSVTYFLEDEIGTVEGSLWIHPDEEEESNIVERYHSLEEEKGELEERLETLEDKTEVEHIEEEMSMFRTLMSEAENAMNQDDYVTMSEKISEAERLRLDITDGIEDIEEELGVPWLWIGTGVIVILIAGIIIYMLLPPEEGYAKSKGYKSPSEKSFKDKLSDVKEKVKEKVFGEEEEGYSYQA